MEKRKFELNKLIKTLLIFLFYFTYTNIANSICNIFGITYDLSIALYADCVFMAVIVYIYQNNIKNEFKDFKNIYNWKKLIKTILMWTGIIFCLIVIISALAGDVSENTKKIKDIYNISLFYSIFKTMIFSVIAEELLFRESIRDIIHNKLIFIVISAFIYSIFNIIYTELSFKYFLTNILSIYFFPSLLFSTAYIKNNSNIIILMLIKFTYNLIPLTILLLGI